MNGPVHVGKEDKMVKQYYYVTYHRNYTDECPQYDTTSLSLSCQIEQESICTYMYLSTWPQPSVVSVKGYCQSAARREGSLSNEDNRS